MNKKANEAYCYYKRQMPVWGTERNVFVSVG